jgi:putative membrane protein
MSPLQTQYPLSPRKFLKKFIGKLTFWGIVWLLLIGISAFVWSAASSSTTPSDQAVGSLLVSIMLGITALIFIGLVLYAWYLRVYIRRYYYDAGDNFVTIKKGVFAPAEIHVMYQKIQDVYVDQDILDRIMGLYDVHIASATATSGMEAHIDGVNHDSAEGLKNLLLNRIQSGGTTQAGAAAQAAAPQVPAMVTLSEDISIKTYPLSGRWMTQQIVMWFFSSIFVSGFITLYVSLPGKNSTASLTDDFGISWAPTWLVIFIVVYIFHIVYAFLWRSTYSFSFLPEYIQMKSGIISRSEVHVPYRAVQDVTVTQGVIERLFGLSTVNIENAAQAQMVGRKLNKTGVQIPGQTLEKANHIAEVVRSVTLTKNTAQTGL